MRLRGLLTFLTCAPVLAAQEGIESRAPRTRRAPEREAARARAEQIRELALPPAAMGVAFSRGLDGQVTADVFVRAAPGVEQALEARGARVGARAGEWLTATVPLASLREIARLPGVKGVELARLVQTYTSTMNDIGAAGVRRRVDRDEFEGATGQGTIFGIVDTGIDFRHGDFTDDVTGRSRILYLWDQNPTLGVSNVPPGIVGGINFNYGRECRQSQLGPNGTCPSRDTNGHGTHVAGIAAGDGSGANRGQPRYDYVGVAPEADIIAVKMRGTTSSVADGVAYIFARAQQLGRPAVVNLSLGTQLGPHDGSDGLSKFLDEISGSGRIVVAAAGNEGSNFLFEGSLHGETTVAVGDSGVIEFELENYGRRTGGGNDYMLLQAFYANADTFTVIVQRPDGSRLSVGMNATSSSAGPGGGLVLYNGSAQGDTVLGSNLESSSFFSATTANMFEAFIGEWVAGASDPLHGTWRLIFHRTGGSASGVVDAYLPLVALNAAPVFTTGATNRRLVGSPASAERVIAVGGYNAIDRWEGFDGREYFFVDGDVVYPLNELLLFSSPGPTRDGRLKPEIVAPGIALSAMSDDASFGGDSRGVSPDSAHVVELGTSMASPHVAGAVALLLSVYQKLTPEQALDALTRGARRDAFTNRTFTGEPNTSPNASWGFGKLNVAASLDIVRSLIGEDTEAYNISQNPVRRAPVVIRFNEAPRRVDLFDFAGKRVRTFLSTDFDDARTIRWNLRGQGGGEVVNGVYLLVADLPSGLMRRKVFIVR
ncbi:MAG: S8 family serine peptidase [Gemmatimonadaceae bacterium]